MRKAYTQGERLTRDSNWWLEWMRGGNSSVRTQGGRSPGRSLTSWLPIFRRRAAEGKGLRLGGWCGQILTWETKWHEGAPCFVVFTKYYETNSWRQAWKPSKDKILWSEYFPATKYNESFRGPSDVSGGWKMVTPTFWDPSGYVPYKNSL